METRYIQLQFCIGKMPSNSQCPNNKADKKYGSYFVTSITRIGLFGYQCVIYIGGAPYRVGKSGGGG